MHSLCSLFFHLIYIFCSNEIKSLMLAVMKILQQKKLLIISLHSLILMPFFAGFRVQKRIKTKLLLVKGRQKKITEKENATCGSGGGIGWDRQLWIFQKVVHWFSFFSFLFSASSAPRCFDRSIDRSMLEMKRRRKERKGESEMESI